MNQVLVCKMRNIRPHPTRPDLRIAEVLGRQVVTGYHYTEGQIGLFIPDGAIVPDALAEEMWLKGKLSGKKANRVKAKDMAGVRSEGLFYGRTYFVSDANGNAKYHVSKHWNNDWCLGDDVANQLGITFKEDKTCLSA